MAAVEELEQQRVGVDRLSDLFITESADEHQLTYVQFVGTYTPPRSRTITVRDLHESNESSGFSESGHRSYQGTGSGNSVSGAFSETTTGADIHGRSSLRQTSIRPHFAEITSMSLDASVIRNSGGSDELPFIA